MVSGLEYGSEVWGFDLFPAAEQVQYQMGRSILRCSFKASRPAVTGELGMISLYGRCYKKLMFWFNLVNLPDSRLIKQVFLESKVKANSRSNWYKRVEGIFKKYNLANIWNDNKLIFKLPGSNIRNQNSCNLQQYKDQWKIYVRKKILAYEEQEWRILINNNEEYSKLRTYCRFKTNLRLEDYLSNASNTRGRALHTSLRIGSNQLNIDMGRKYGLEEKDRLCKYCTLNAIESEFHFLVECPKYNNLRINLYSKICALSNNKWDLSKVTQKDCFLLLINGTLDEYQHKIFLIFHNYLVSCFKLRNAVITE